MCQNLSAIEYEIGFRDVLLLCVYFPPLLGEPSVSSDVSNSVASVDVMYSNF